jgi:hypothetical protein
MKIFTIGFTKKSARTFFTKLRESGALRVVDVRLNNVSQLAGFAKKDDWVPEDLGPRCGADIERCIGSRPSGSILPIPTAKVEIARPPSVDLRRAGGSLMQLGRRGGRK